MNPTLNKKDFDLQESKKFVSESIKILDDNKYIILIEKIPICVTVDVIEIKSISMLCL